MFILSITRSAKAAGPSINLPPGTVNATFTYPASNSYWTVTLSSVPSGYDVTNGAYNGWCNDETHYITPSETLGVTLYSSYDQSVYPGDWFRVNYIINHPQGVWQDLQDAIWYYIDGHSMPSSAAGIAMVNAANANGGSFEPASGQLLAVVVWKAGYQTTFISLQLPKVQLTVTSTYDSPTPTSGPYTPGTSITASITPTVAGPAGMQYVCTGWTGTGDVPATGTATSTTFTITQDSSITWLWKTQYLLTVKNGGHGTSSGTSWYDAGQPATFSISPTAIPAGLHHWVFTGWSSSDFNGYIGSASSKSVTMNNPITETANWIYSVDPSVGGEWTPITMQTLSPVNTLQLLAPWVALALIAVVSAVAAYKRLLKKH